MVTVPHPLMLATFVERWELVLILGVLLTLLGARWLPKLMQGMRDGMSEVRKELDQQAHDAGRSAGGIYGKPACEALTPDNQTAELYDHAALRRHIGKRSVRQFVRALWRNILQWLRSTIKN